MRILLRGLLTALALAAATPVPAADPAVPDAATIEQRLATVKADTALAHVEIPGITVMRVL